MQDVASVLSAARDRGIRVIPEIDTPGHSDSWGNSHPELLVPCYDEVTKEPSGAFGAIDPTIKSSYELVMVRKGGQEGAVDSQGVTRVTVYVYCPLRGGRIPGFHRQSIPFRKTTQLPVAHTRLFMWKVNTKFDFPEHAPSCHQGSMPLNLSRIEIRTGDLRNTK